MASELYAQVQDIEERIFQLEDNANTFPVEQEATDAMFLSFNTTKWYYGTAQLSGGTKTLLLPQVSTNSIGFITTNGSPYTYTSGSATVGATYGVTCTTGQIVITSSSGSDNSIVNYWIILDSTQ